MSSRPTRRQKALVVDHNNTSWTYPRRGMAADDIRSDLLENLRFRIAKDRYSQTIHDTFLSLSLTVRERLIERWIVTQQKYHEQNAKRVYYLSMEFLLGRLLHNNIMNLGLRDSTLRALSDLGLSYEDILDQEYDAGLGNGGLGRLAACFLDSMATLKLPAIGYGIRYEFGIFRQKIVGGQQRELPEEWLQFGNPWETVRPEYRVTVKLYGHTKTDTDESGKQVLRWVETKDVEALPYDIPVPGYGTDNVNTLRLWAARAAHELDLADFHEGDYIGACQDKIESENISKVLYPNDSNHSGKELRLKQQHFFTSASLQDIIRRFTNHNEDFAAFPDKVAIQINDTHPAIAIVELQRLLHDEHKLPWEQAWDIVTRTFAYTNHTLMPEALERWPVGLMQELLPRHMEIIYEINQRFLRRVSYTHPGDTGLLSRMSLIEEGHEPHVRMAYLAIVGSHSVNGVAALHTELLKSGLMKDFYRLWPRKFNNKTNGITQRRWLYCANPALSELIGSTIGNEWIQDLSKLGGLQEYLDDPSFQQRWREVKQANKHTLAQRLERWEGIRVNPDTLFDIQVKRIHEYKRQLMAALHCIALYRDLKRGVADPVPRTVLFGGKAAPGYTMAKLIIRFISDVATVINDDPDTKDLLQVHFVPNYRVTLAEALIPAADLSEQISTAGTEASGTGNMKFALNGAITIGTLDGANIEISQDVGAENMFIFGLQSEEVEQLREQGYDPRKHFQKSEALMEAFELVRSGFFSPQEPQRYQPILDSLLEHGDRFMVVADFESYCQCQRRVEEAYRDRQLWTRMSIANTANVGRFSSDRTIRQYAEGIWNVTPVPVNLRS